MILCESETIVNQHCELVYMTRIGTPEEPATADDVESIEVLIINARRNVQTYHDEPEPENVIEEQLVTNDPDWTVDDDGYNVQLIIEDALPDPHAFYKLQVTYDYGDHKDVDIRYVKTNEIHKPTEPEGS